MKDEEIMLNNYVNRYELSEQIDSALNCLDSYRKILTHLKESCDYPEDGLFLTHEEKDKMLLSEISRKYFSVWETTEVFLRLLDGITVCGIQDRDDADRLKHDVFKKTAWIGCDRIGDSLYVKLPWLPLKKHYRNAMYQDELRYELDLLGKSKGIPKLSQKMIHFVSVYKTDTSLLKIPDNDNYDTKRIIDILTDYVGGGDGGAVCSIHIETILNDEIPEGTYIIVSPETTEFKKGEAHIDEFKRLIETIKNDQ